MILGISTSSLENSFPERMLKKVLKLSNERTVHVNLRDLQIRKCTLCTVCNPADQNCTYIDDVNLLVPLMKKARVIIFTGNKREQGISNLEKVFYERLKHILKDKELEGISALGIFSDFIKPFENSSTPILKHEDFLSMLEQRKGLSLIGNLTLHQYINESSSGKVKGLKSLEFQKFDDCDDSDELCFEFGAGKPEEMLFSKDRQVQKGIWSVIKNKLELQYSDYSNWKDVKNGEGVAKLVAFEINRPRAS